MNKGKLAEPVLKRSIFKRIKNKRPEIVCGPAVGIDASMVKLEADELFVISTDSFNDINKDDPDGWIIFAKSKAKLGQKKDALRVLEAYENKSPDNKEIQALISAIRSNTLP